MSRRRRFVLFISILLLVGSSAAQAARDVVGATSTRLAWAAAPGQVHHYAIFVSRDGSAYPSRPERLTPAGSTSVTLSGRVGETLRVRIAARDAQGRQGPFSPESEAIRFVAGPTPPAGGDDGRRRRGAAARRDLDHDGSSDLLIWDAAGGELRALLDPAGSRASVRIQDGVDPGWRIAATGDFDGNGELDLFWRHDASLRTGVWLFAGLEPGFASTAALDSPAWRVAAAADFDGDGRTDLLWRHEERGATGVWLMRGAEPSFHGMPDVETSSGWRVVAAGDFDADGKGDLYWVNDATGGAGFWFMDGTEAPDTRADPAPPAPGWTVETCADFDGDGSDDLFLRHRESGANAISFMDGSSASAVPVAGLVGLGWRAIGSGDFDGDGRADLLWQHTGNGRSLVWFMDGSVRLGTRLVSELGVIGEQP